MVRLYSFVLFSVIILLCKELSTTSKVPDADTSLKPCLHSVEDEMIELKLQMSKLHTKMAQQNTKMAHQNTKFEAQNVKISDQNTKLTEQDIKILEQNSKIKDLERKMEKERKQNIELLTNNSTFKVTGSLFTRWGRKDCPRNVSQLVYSGLTGGSFFLHTGGAAEYVCLPPDPIWNSNKYFNGSSWGYMYGARYKQIPKPLVNYKVPCAVCRTSQFTTVLMIPARSECYQGWQKAYHGELVSGHHNHPAASQYVCLDKDPQTNGTTRFDDGKSMFPVKAQCGSLPCPPYEDNTLLTCVVCLK